MQTDIFDTPQAAAPAPIPPADIAPPKFYESFYYLAEHDSIMTSIYDGTISLERYQAGFERLLASGNALIGELSSMPKDKIIEACRISSRYKNERKDRVISAAIERMITDYALRESVAFVMFQGSYNESVREIVQAQTADTLAAFATRAAAEQAARLEEFKTAMAGVENPQTLDDYRRYMRLTAKDGDTFQGVRMTLTPEQREQFDHLAATESRTQRASADDHRRAHVVANTTATGAQLIETQHTRDGHDLFVVKPADRVDRDVYREWLATSKQLGGYYSRYTGGGAVPGFQFTDKDSALSFLAYVSGGDTGAVSEQIQTNRDAFADDKSQTAAERLTEMADRIEGMADEALTQDRKTNTHRRAEQANRAESAARSNQATAKTMRRIAASLDSGSAVFLDRVRTRTQIDMMAQILSSARAAELRALYPSYVDQQKHEGTPPTIATADHAVFPGYTLHRSELANLARKMISTDGFKQDGTKLLKIADDVTPAYLKWARENLHRVSTFTIKGTDDGAKFKTKSAAEYAISRSGYNGKAINLPFKRGQNIIIKSPSEARREGLWNGDDDKRIGLHPDFSRPLVEKMARRSRAGIVVPWQLETAHETRKRFAAMGIETAPEFRAALREFIGLREQAAGIDKVTQLERSMVGRARDGLDFFPTAEVIAVEMIEAAGLEPGCSVLEPSAGHGHIAEQIRAAGIEPDVIEISSDRRELLALKGFDVIGSDFLAESGTYDRIILNPPFSKRQDVDHVRHAFDLLSAGGRLVALMGEGVFFGSDRKAEDFRDWLESVGGTDEKLPDGSFRDPSLPVTTGANARMVVIDK
jgi:hypothetical protein